MPKAIGDVTFAILDTETTGISVRYGARLCEIAVLLVRDGKAVHEYQTLLDPGVPIDPGAMAVHGITDEMVAGAPKFRQIAGELRDMLDGTVLVCHNMSFDKSFMDAEFRSAGLSMPRVAEVCTLRLARRHFKFRRNGLGHIVDNEIDAAFKRANGMSTQGAHRAGNDVRMLYGVFRYFLEHLSRRKRLETLEDLLELARS